MPRYLLIVTVQTSVAAAADLLTACPCSDNLFCRIGLPPIASASPPTQTVLAFTVWEVEMADLFYNDFCLRTLSVPNVVRLVCRVECSHMGLCTVILTKSKYVNNSFWEEPILLVLQCVLWKHLKYV